MGQTHSPASISEEAVDRSYVRSHHAILLANILRIDDDPEAHFDTLDTALRELLASSAKHHEWEALERLASGDYRSIDPLLVPMDARTADLTPMNRLPDSRFGRKARKWVAAYAGIYLAKNREIYLRDRSKSVMRDDALSQTLERKAQFPGKNLLSSTFKNAFLLKMIVGSTILLEQEVRASMPEITRSPGFFLLLACYQTLHSLGFDLRVVHPDSEEGSFLNLIQEMLQRFDPQEHPEVYEYLSGFEIPGAGGDYLSVLSSQIEGEWELERLISRSVVAEETTEALMSRLRGEIARIENLHQ